MSTIHSGAKPNQSIGGTTLWIILVTLFVMCIVAIVLPFVMEAADGAQGPQGEQGTRGTQGPQGDPGADAVPQGNSSITITSSEELYSGISLRFYYIPSTEQDVSVPNYENFVLNKGTLTIWPQGGNDTDWPTKYEDDDIWKNGDFFRVDNEGGRVQGVHYQISKVEHVEADSDNNVPVHTVLTLVNEPDDGLVFGFLDQKSVMSRLRIASVEGGT